MPTEFNDQIKQFAARVEQIHSSIQTEEATKMSMIFSSLGMTFSIPVNSVLNLLLMSASKKEKRLIMPF